MKQTRGHRAFTYMEKKFNSLGRTGLTEHFRKKFLTVNPDKVADALHEEKGIIIDRTKAIKITKMYEQKVWDTEEKVKVNDLVDMILGISDTHDITNIEAYAHYCHVIIGTKIALKKKKGLKDLTESQAETLFTNIVKEETEKAYRLRLDDWNKFMRVLKLVT